MPGPADPTERAQRAVEERLEELGDPEGAPANPAGTLAVGSGAGVPDAPASGRYSPGTSREIWRLAWPVMLSQGLAALVALVDVAMVGRLGPEAQAAVGYAVQLFFVSQSALFALSFACVAVMARAIGAGNAADSRRAFAASLFLALGAALVLSGLMLLAPETLLGWLSASPEVVALCIPYLQYLMVSAVLMGVSLTIESGLRANKDTRTPLRITVVVTVVKIALNVLLIFGVAGFPEMGVAGAGLATLGAQVVALGLFAGAIASSPRDGPTGLRRRDLNGMGRLFPELIRIAIPGVGERLVMNAAMISYFAFIGTYGTVAAATYTIGIRILSLSWIPGIGFQGAVATLVGQALGAGDRAAVLRTGKVAVVMALGVAVVLGAVAAGAHAPIARAFTTDPGTIAALGPFLLFLAAAQPMLQVHFTLAGVHRGAGDTWTPLVAATVGNWGFRVPLAFVLARVFEVELAWLWAPILFDHAVRALWLGRSFRRRDWMGC